MEALGCGNHGPRADCVARHLGYMSACVHGRGQGRWHQHTAMVLFPEGGICSRAGQRQVGAWCAGQCLTTGWGWGPDF